MSNPIRILFCILTTHERNGWVCKQLNEYITGILYETSRVYSAGGVPAYDVQPIHCHNFIPAASARNYFGRMMKDSGADWLVMIDNDMAPTHNLLDTIKGAPEDADIIVPRFSMWDEGKAQIVLCWGMDERKVPLNSGRQWFTIEGQGFYQLTKCGTGCIFIKPRVFEKLEMPYFKYPLNADQGIEGTEDIYFAKKVIDAGMKIYGNSSVSVGHYHNVNLEVVAYAINQAQKGIDKGVTIVPETQERPSDVSVVAACPA